MCVFTFLHFSESKLNFVTLNKQIKIQGGWYCGWFQHGLYNIVYHRIFGASTAISNAIRKVAFDSVFHVPFVIFPVYYVYKAWMLGGQHGSTAMEGLQLYGDEALAMNTRYFSFWIPANMLVFTVVPQHLRIAFIAATSFSWLSLVSFVTLRTEEGKDTIKIEDVEKEKVQTNK